MSFFLSLSRYRFIVRSAPVSSLQWTNQHQQHSNISRIVKSKWVLLLMLCLLLLLFMSLSTLSNTKVTSCATSLRLIKELRTLTTKCTFSCRFVPTKQQFSSLRSYLTPWSSPSSEADGSVVRLEILTFHDSRKSSTVSVTAPSTPLTPILSHINSVRTSPSYFFQIKSQIILPSTSCSSKWSPYFRFRY